MGLIGILLALGRRSNLPPAYLSELARDHGLAGSEVDHQDHDRASRAELREIARSLGLVVTGSSDYHGLGKPNQPGEHTTSDEMVARISDRATGSAPVHPG